MQVEGQLQEQITGYLRLAYPDVPFRSDLGGIRLTLGQAAKVKRVQGGRAWPDLFLAQACGGYHGFFIELKREGVRIYKQDGELVADQHIREQAAMLEKLRGKGYRAEFACGWSEAKHIIDDYLKS